MVVKTRKYLKSKKNKIQKKNKTMLKNKIMGGGAMNEVIPKRIVNPATYKEIIEAYMLKYGKTQTYNLKEKEVANQEYNKKLTNHEQIIDTMGALGTISDSKTPIETRQQVSNELQIPSENNKKMNLEGHIVFLDILEATAQAIYDSKYKKK